MANKLTKRRYNNLLTARNNYFDAGGFWANPFKGAGGMDAKKALTSAAGAAVGQIGGSLIGGGMQSGAGSVLQGLSGVAAAIPGPWGAGLGVLGGLINRMFGSKMNTENIAKVEANINNLNNFQSNASDFDTLSQNWANAEVGMTFSDSFIGKDGWLSNKAKNKAADLRGQVEAGNAWAQNSLNNNAENIGTTQMQNLLANYAAFGGPLFAEGGRIHIKPENRGKFTETKRRTGKTTEELTHSKNPVTRKRAIFAQNAAKWHHADGGNLYGDGGYTWQDGLKDAASFLPFVGSAIDAYDLYEDPSWENAGYLSLGLLAEIPFLKPLRGIKAVNRLRKLNDAGKRAIIRGAERMPDIPIRPSKTVDKIGEYVSNPFVITDLIGNEIQVLSNSRASGGDPMTHGANFDTGVTLVGNGNTHENNPYGGVPMGVDPEGTPNLVEEGEVIFNDYVFSNRLKVPKAVGNKYKLRGTKPLTFAEAALLMGKESEERPNDSISLAGLEDSMQKLMITLELIRTKKKSSKTFSKGGRLGRVYAGTEDDPYSQALALGMGPVEPSFMWALTAPAKSTPAPKNEMGIVLGGYTSNPTIIKPGESTIPGIIDTLKTKYPSPPASKEANDDGDETGRGISISPTWMRYIPAVASGVMSITDMLGLTNKPDYGEAEAMLEASRGAGLYTPIKFNPVGNYLTYKPFDRDFYTNKLNAESSAARRAILNTSGGNRAQAMAGILAADYNSQEKMGDLFRQAEEYNLAQRQKVEEFNRATNMFNSEGMLKADQANQSAQLQARSSYLKGALAAAETRQKERQAATAARSANLSNFINSLGDIGRENFSRNMIVSDPSKYYSIGSNGEISYKNSFYDLSEAEQDYITGHANRKSKSKRKARGGYLTIKRK